MFSKNKTQNIEPEEYYKELRNRMVEEQIIKRGIKDKNVLRAMRKVPRHKFINPEQLKTSYYSERYMEIAYSDRPLPIEEDQTISQPYIVALMTECLRLDHGDRILEIGTGSGYQAAVLAEIVADVYTLELAKSLAERSRRQLEDLGYKNVQVKNSDGYRGWEEFAPYDAIIVTAAPTHIPKTLISQLKVGGRMIIPVGDYHQELMLITKTKEGFERENVASVRFVPMRGDALKGGIGNY